MDKLNVGYENLIGLQYIFKEDILQISNDANGFAVVTPNTGKIWIDLYFTPGSGKWQETSGRTGAGILFKQQLSMLCLRDTPAEWELLNSISRRPMILKLKFKNGNKIAGSKDSPVRLNVNTDTSSGMGITVSMEKETHLMARWIV